MKTIKGPGIFLAQFAGNAEPFNTLKEWRSGRLGWDLPGYRFRPGTAAFRPEARCRKPSYCDELAGVMGAAGLQSPSSRRLCKGSWSPATQRMISFQGFCATGVCKRFEGPPSVGSRTTMLAAKASSHLGLKAHATFSGALAWPFFIPAASAGGADRRSLRGVGERWLPILQAFDEAAWTLLRTASGEDLHDGATFERFLMWWAGTNAPISLRPSHMVCSR